MHIHYKAH